jgi:hypothetical protein
MGNLDTVFIYSKDFLNGSQEPNGWISSEVMNVHVAARLAGGGVLKIDPAGKPCCYGYAVLRGAV